MSNQDLQIETEEKDKKYTGPYRKPRADIYTVMLLLALFAILLGILCLYFEMDMYGFEFEWSQPASSVAPNVAVAFADITPAMLSTDAPSPAEYRWL